MTKHATFVADDAATAPAQAGQHLSSFPPLVTAGARLQEARRRADGPRRRWRRRRRRLGRDHEVPLAAPRHRGGARRLDSTCYMPRIDRSFFCLHPVGAFSLELPALKSIDRAQESHPSALAWFESALSAAKGKQIVMFLDYDGTLSLIVKDPDAAVMSDEVRSFFSLLCSLLLLPSNETEHALLRRRRC
jgi:hypothetical protein